MYFVIKQIIELYCLITFVSLIVIIIHDTIIDIMNNDENFINETSNIERV